MKAVKILIVLLFVLCLALLGASITVFLAKRAESARRIQTEEQLNYQKSENKKLSLAYEQLDLAKQQAEEKSLAERQELENRLKDETAKLKEMEAALAQEREKRTSAETDLDKIKDHYQKLSGELEVLQRQYSELGLSGAAGAPGKLASEIELPPIVVHAKKTEPSKVLVLNRDFNFVVIDQGEQDGLMKGEFLALSRDGKPVAKIQADKVYDGFAACAIIEESQSNPIQEGDLVAKQ